MRITLILAAAPDDPLRRQARFQPLSLPLLAGAAPGHDYTFVDMLAGDRPDWRAPADLVGISLRVTAERTAFRLADECRRRGLPVVLGGPQASVRPHAAARHADAVAVGEAEALWPRLLDDFAAGRLRRFYLGRPGPFDAQGASVRPAERWLDLAAVRPPDRRPYRRRYRVDTIFAARGCPVGCDFCSVPELHGRGFRARPVGEVVREFDGLGDFVYLLDDNVLGRPGSYGYYAELYDALAKLPRNRLWMGQANLQAAASAEGRDVIRRAAGAGMVEASVGIESLNPAVQRRTGAWAKMGVDSAERFEEGVREHLRFLQDQGIVVSGWFVLGYEEDTLADFRRTLAFCEENHVVPVLNAVEALPGTRLWERLEREGRLSPTASLNVVHPTLRPEAIREELAALTRRAYTLSAIGRRTRFYAARFGVRGARERRIADRIRRTVFTFVMQQGMKSGLTRPVNAG